MCSFNEIAHIEHAYNDVMDSLSLRKETAEVIFIDNGSVDGTREWLSKLRDPKVTVLLNETNLGKGGSIKRGFHVAKGQFVVIHDTDFEYRAADVWKAFDLAQSEKLDTVLGSRVLAGEIKHKYYINYMGVKLLTSLLNLLYGLKLTDSATAIKLFKTSFVRTMEFNCNGFDLDFQLVTRIARAGGQIGEVAAQYYPRTVAQGKKIRPFKDGLGALWTILRDRLTPVLKMRNSEHKDMGLET